MRLDHLLSKEHTPRQVTNVCLRMVVFTSGIVDEGPAAAGSACLVLPALGVGVERAWCWWGGLSGTLLGPEGSGWLAWWLRFLPLLHALLCGCVGLVGLLFEICIVDASIFVVKLCTCRHPLCGVVVGVGCVVSIVV